MPSDDFDFSLGDRLLVRIREGGRQVAKFEATALDFKERPGRTADKVLLSPVWDESHVGSLSFCAYEAEFEVISGGGDDE